jgi:hypothetical protein
MWFYLGRVVFDLRRGVQSDDNVLMIRLGVE